MSFGALPTELQQDIMSRLVNVEKDCGGVRVTRHRRSDGEQCNRYMVFRTIFSINRQSWNYAWDQISATLLVEVSISGSLDMRPSSIVPVLTENAVDVARIPIASRRGLKIPRVAISATYDPLSLAPNQLYFYHALLPFRSFAVYLRHLAAKQSGVLPPGLGQEPPGRFPRAITAIYYRITISVVDDTGPWYGRGGDFPAAFEPLHYLGNNIEFGTGNNSLPVRFEGDIHPDRETAIKHWYDNMYAQTLNAKLLLDRFYIEFHASVFSLRSQDAWPRPLPVRFYDTAQNCYRFALRVRSLLRVGWPIDRSWLDSADQLAVCAALSLMSVDIYYINGGLQSSVTRREPWPHMITTRLCIRQYCPCLVLDALGYYSMDRFDLYGSTPCGLDIHIWLVMKHILLVYHGLPLDGLELSHIVELIEDLRLLMDEMCREFKRSPPLVDTDNYIRHRIDLEGSSDDVLRCLESDIGVLETIAEQWDAHDKLEPPFELFYGEAAAYRRGTTVDIVLGRLTPTRHTCIVIISDGRPTLRHIPRVGGAEVEAVGGNLVAESLFLNACNRY